VVLCSLPPGCLNKAAGAEALLEEKKSPSPDQTLFLELKMKIDSSLFNILKAILIVADGRVTTAIFWCQCLFCPTP